MAGLIKGAQALKKKKKKRCLKMFRAAKLWQIIFKSSWREFNRSDGKKNSAVFPMIHMDSPGKGMDVWEVFYTVKRGERRFFFSRKRELFGIRTRVTPVLGSNR